MQRLQMWLHRDHQALLQLLRWLAECDPERQLAACLSVLRRTQRHIDAHLCIEDEILFPVLEHEHKSHELLQLRSAHGRLRHAIGKLNGARINADWLLFQHEARQLWREFLHLETYEQQVLGKLIDERLLERDEEQLWQACVAIRQRVGLPVLAANDGVACEELAQAI